MVMGQVRARSSSVASGHGSPQSGSDTDDTHKHLIDSDLAKSNAPMLESKQLLASGKRNWRRWALLSALVVGSFILISSWDTPIDLSKDTFVTVDGTQFEHQCRPFFVAGFNVDNVGQAPISALARKMRGSGYNGRRLVRELLRKATDSGLNVMRTFAHTTDPNYPMQIRPGQYDEDVFRALDFVIAEAGRSGVKVILSLVDNWKYAGGVDEFVDWSAGVPPRDPKFPPINKLGDVTLDEYSPERRQYEDKRKAYFYLDSACRDMFKNHVKTVLLRKNVYTGVAYKDDPTIMGWNLVNEPRCSAYETPDCPSIFSRWVAEMAAHVKDLDSRHLVTVGMEGFWGQEDPLKALNPGMPGSDWAAFAGQDFALDHSSPHIDFATVHDWPDNWNIHNYTFHRVWIEKHIQEAATVLKKPLLLEEFGKVLGRGQNPPPNAIKKHRDPVFEMVYDVVEPAVAKGLALVGSMFWRWGFNVYDNDLPGPYGVLPEHSTFDLVVEHSRRMKAHLNSHPPNPSCNLECWVPKTSMFGMLRRCENRPSLCSERWSSQEHTRPAAGNGTRLGAHGGEMFTSQRDCCRAGLGAFSRGCTTTWL